MTVPVAVVEAADEEIAITAEDLGGMPAEELAMEIDDLGGIPAEELAMVIEDLGGIPAEELAPEDEDCRDAARTCTTVSMTWMAPESSAISARNW